MRTWLTQRLCLLLVLICAPAFAGASTFSGVFEGVSNRSLALDASGVVAEVNVTVGETIAPGDLLLELNSDAERIEVERRRLQAQDRSELTALTRQMQIARDRYAILAELHESGRSVSREQLLSSELEQVRAETAYRQAELRESREALEYELAQAALEARQLRSPISGIVARIERKPGEWLSTGEAAAEVVDLSALVLRVNVPEQTVRGLMHGDEYPVALTDGRSAPAVLTDIAPIADAATGLIELRFRIDNTGLGLRPGMEGSVDLGGSP